jgi:hypothetical protein
MKILLIVAVALTAGSGVVFGMPLFFMLKRFWGWKRLWWD